ncbi:hypothetical protein J1614_011314 [Plenodomus biglobosus]|nr:hypothetical protein J1614_011314 [Plenodomus biglobosus]
MPCVQRCLADAELCACKLTHTNLRDAACANVNRPAKHASEKRRASRKQMKSAVIFPVPILQNMSSVIWNLGSVSTQCNPISKPKRGIGKFAGRIQKTMIQMKTPFAPCKTTRDDPLALDHAHGAREFPGQAVKRSITPSVRTETNMLERRLKDRVEVKGTSMRLAIYHLDEVEVLIVMKFSCS